MVDGFKHTDAGLIPVDWQTPKLATIASFENGKAHEQFIDENGEFIVVNSKFISTEGEVVKLSKENLSPLKKGNIAIVMSDIPNGKALAKCFFIEEDNRYTLNQRIGCIKSEKEYDEKYLFYKLNRNKYFLSFDSGSGQTNLRKQEIIDCLVALPPTKAEQTAIATALNDADNLISSLEKLIAKKRAIKQGAMQELLKPKEGWVKKKLGKIADIFDGTHQTPKYVDIGYPFYSVENVTSNDFINTKFISSEEHKILNKSRKIEKGDILMTRIGSLGVCKYIDWDVDASFYVSLALIKLNKSYSAKYITQYSNTSEFKKEVDSNALLFAYPQKINLGEISKIIIYIPKEKTEQNRIAQILFDFDIEISELKKKLNKYKMLKQGMMQSLLTGKIRLV